MRHLKSLEHRNKLIHLLSFGDVRTNQHDGDEGVQQKQNQAKSIRQTLLINKFKNKQKLTADREGQKTNLQKQNTSNSQNKIPVGTNQQQQKTQQNQQENQNNQQTKPKCRKRPMEKQQQKQQKLSNQSNRQNQSNTSTQQPSKIVKKRNHLIQFQQRTQKDRRREMPKLQATNGQISNQKQQNYQQLQDTQQNSKYPYCDELNSGSRFPVIPLLCVVFGILLVAFLIWLVITIRKRIATTKQYNQTPENFIEKPTLSLNQSKNLKLHTVKIFQNYQQVDVLPQNKTEFGGIIYELKFMNKLSQNFSAVYWSKTLKTDCYFEVQIQTLNSEIQFGFINKKFFSLMDSGVQTKIGRVGVSLNSQGNLQLLGQIKYQFRWNLEYGDVIGLGITELDKNKRVWVTKNGLLLNPPTSQQIQKWLSKQSLSQQHRDAYDSINKEGKNKQISKKQDIQLAKKKITLPANEDFQYYAVVGSWEIKNPTVKKGKKYQKENQTFNFVENPVTTVRFNVGGKTFRLRDHNLRSGLLADSIQKNQFCNWLPCF